MPGVECMLSTLVHGNTIYGHAHLYCILSCLYCSPCMRACHKTLRTNYADHAHEYAGATVSLHKPKLSKLLCPGMLKVRLLQSGNLPNQTVTFMVTPIKFDKKMTHQLSMVDMPENSCLQE